MTTDCVWETRFAHDLLAEAFAMLPRLTPLTAVRVIRNYGEYFEKIGNLTDAEFHLMAAQVLARKEGLTDQVGKIRPIFARVRAKKERFSGENRGK